MVWFGVDCPRGDSTTTPTFPSFCDSRLCSVFDRIESKEGSMIFAQKTGYDAIVWLGGTNAISTAGRRSYTALLSCWSAPGVYRRFIAGMRCSSLGEVIGLPWSAGLVCTSTLL